MIQIKLTVFILNLVVFSWDDALFSEKVVCNCIQYEKAAVLFNAASVYSHLGATQFFKTSEGKKKAAIYFRKSANLLIFCRDSLCQRLKVKISGNSDLDESTLSALSNIMMAQAVECFYEKANEVNTSSQVTSQIAIEVADHYENALQFTSSNTFPLSRDKLPKNWIMTARTKAHLFTAIAHFHAPSTMSTEVLVAERIARLYLAKTFIDKSLKCSYGGSLQSITMGYSDLITTNLNMTQTENFQRYHQPEMDARLLSPLRHASQDLFTGIDTHPLGDLDRFPDFFHSLISPTRHIDIKNFYNESIKTVESNLMMLKGLINSIEKSASIGASVPNLSNIVAFDSNKLDSKDKSALELIEKIRSCRITEETTPSQELINSLTRQHTTMKTMLTDSIQILKTTTKQGQQVQEMMEKTQSFVESITSIKHTIRDLLSIHDRIKQTGLTDWTDSELRELLPCIDAEYNDIAFIENMKTMPEIIQREKESLIVKLDDLKHRVTLAINEFSKLGSNSALFWRDCESSSIEKHKEQLRIAEDAGILLKRETSNLVLKIDVFSNNLGN